MRNESGSYFVMLRHPECGHLPMIDNDDNVAWFDTEQEAVAAGSDSFLGEGFGFEVFCIGHGEVTG